MDKQVARIHVGTSGWSYSHWKKAFYPDRLPEAQWLEFYAKSFDTVEINNSFYRLPSSHTLAAWTRTVPKRFLFTVKASRYITHMKKLKDPKKSTRSFFRRIEKLGDRLGPILFQLPPRWRFDEERMKNFLTALSRDYRYAFEFRDRSWINDHTLEMLEQARAAFCIYDLDGYISPKPVTTDFAYIRLHGPNGPYRGSYSEPDLANWASTLCTWAGQKTNIFCYFDNDQRGYAVQNASKLQDVIES